tara:strand:- start:219 stop:482 length:264 start_codon:yes stop_codon:yes gene_type:complete
MTSKSSQNLLSIKEYEAIISEPAIFKNPCSESDYLCSQSKFLQRSLWFKGSRDRCLREGVAGQYKHFMYSTSFHTNRFELKDKKYLV